MARKELNTFDVTWFERHKVKYKTTVVAHDADEAKKLVTEGKAGEPVYLDTYTTKIIKSTIRPAKTTGGKFF